MAFSTLNEVAKIAGCSANTVSRYINKKGYIRSETAEKIQKAIDSLNYYPSLSARSMKKFSSNTISIIVPSIKNDFYVEIIRETENKLKEHGFYLMIFETKFDPDREKYLIGLSISFRVAGIIMISIYDSSDKLLNSIIKINKIPIVFLEVIHKNINSDYIYMQNEYGSFLLIDHLIKVHDKKNIGILLSPLENNVSIQRYKGYIKALKENGIKYNENIVKFCSVNKLNGYKYAIDLLKKGEIDALYTANTIFGIGAIKAFDELNIKYPDEISFLTFDEYDINTLIHPYLTSLNRVDKKFGTLAADLIIDRLSKKIKNFKKIEIGLELNIRESCGCKL